MFFTLRRIVTDAIELVPCESTMFFTLRRIVTDAIE